MFRLLLVALSCVAAAFCGLPVHDGKILGGSTASPGQFPYQISMRQRASGQHHCGGTIISSRTILTAAHCVYQQSPSDFIVVVGTNTLSHGGTAYTIATALYHGNYEPQNIVNDIALLILSSDIDFSSTVEPLPLQTGEVPPGAQLILSGWGLTSWPGSAPPNDLQYVALTSIDLYQCAQALAPGVITQGNICTYTWPEQGACAGDSGGPLYYNGAVAGIVSWGQLCAIGKPDVFTSVAVYADWIRANMA